jgi:hypothetical protein
MHPTPCQAKHDPSQSKSIQAKATIRKTLGMALLLLCCILPRGAAALASDPAQSKQETAPASPAWPQPPNLIRAGARPGAITIRAEGFGLKLAVATIESKPYTWPRL